MPISITRATVLTDISLAPYAVIKRGEAGTVVRSEAGPEGTVALDILLDKTHTGLARWNNEAHLVSPEISAVKLHRGFPRLNFRVNLSYPAIVAAGVSIAVGLVEALRICVGLGVSLL